MADLSTITLDGVTYNFKDAVTPSATATVVSTYSSTGTDFVDGKAVKNALSSVNTVTTFLSSTTSVSLAAGTNVSLGSFSVPAGIWILEAQVTVGTASGGFRYLQLSTASGGSTGSHECENYSPISLNVNAALRSAFIARLSAATTYYLFARGDYACSAVRHAVRGIRIGDYV